MAKLPLTRYGIREIFAFGGLFAAGAIAGAFFWWPLAIVFALLALGAVGFFRDPRRAVPEGEGLLVAPADGKVTAVGTVDDARVGGPCRRIEIFLSILDVHINRAPAAGSVTLVDYVRGRYLNALGKRASRENESNLVVFSLRDRPEAKVGVRQIAGAIARRIVCDTKVGDSLCRGETFGMIKFGSRTELYIPTQIPCEILVTVGQKVRAGETVLGKLR